MPSSFAIDELEAIVARIVSAIESGGGEMNLRDLQHRLVDLTVAVGRSPGLMAATEDLFAAAAAMVRDSGVQAQPEARKRRLLRDARRRFDERLAARRAAGLSHSGAAIRANTELAA